MKKITYSIISCASYVTEADSAHSKCTEFQFEGEEVTHLKIGERIFKAVSNSCLIDVSLLDEGDYTPVAIGDGIALELDRITVRGENILLTPDTASYVKISKELCEAIERIRSTEDSVRLLSDAVFGAKLF